MKNKYNNIKVRGGLLSDLVSQEELIRMDVMEDGSQACKPKKASNQNEYGDEIGLTEAEQILSDLQEQVEADISNDNNTNTFIDNADEAFADIEEITDQKEIIDESIKSGNLSSTAALIFRQDCERYLQKTNGKNQGKFDGKYLDPDVSGLQSDNIQSLEAGLQSVWDSVVQAIQSVAASIGKGFIILEDTIDSFLSNSVTTVAALIRSVQYTNFKNKLGEKGASGKILLPKGKVNSFINNNYIAFSVVNKTNRVDGKNLIDMINMMIDYIKVDKLPYIKTTDKGLEVLPIDSGSMPKLEKLMSKFFVEKIIKNPMDSSAKSTKKKLLNTLEDGGFTLDDVKENNLRMYSIFGATVWSVLYTPDGKNFMANLSYTADKNYIFKRSENVQTEADLVNLSFKELDDILDNIVKFMETDIKAIINLQRKKINDLKKFSEIEIKKMEAAVKIGDVSNMKVWKARKQDIVDYWRTFPSLITISNMEMLTKADEIASLISSAKAQGN